MKSKLTAEHIDDVLNMYAYNYDNSKRATKSIGEWARNGDGHTVLYVNSNVYDTKTYEPKKDDFGNIVAQEPYYKLGERKGQLVLSMFYGTIMEFAGRVVDLSVAKNSYDKYLNDDTDHCVTMVGSKLKLVYLDRMCRMMQCIGADIVDVYSNTYYLQFVAKNGDDIAAVCVVTTLMSDTPLKSMGGIVVHDTNDSTQIDDSIAISSLNEAREHFVKSENDIKYGRKLFHVQLVKYEWCYVYANTEKEARQIAVDHGDELDWDDSPEFEYIEDADVDDICDYEMIFGDEGEMDLDELIEYMVVEDDDEDDND